MQREGPRVMPDAMMTKTTADETPEQTLVRELGVHPIPLHRGWYDPRTGEVLATLVPREAYALSQTKNMWYVCLPASDGRRKCRSVGRLVAAVFDVVKPRGASHIVAIKRGCDGGLPVIENLAWRVKIRDGFELQPLKDATQNAV